MEIENEGFEEEQNIEFEELDLDEIMRSQLSRVGKHSTARLQRFETKHKTPKAIRKKRAKRKMVKNSRKKNRK